MFISLFVRVCMCVCMHAYMRVYVRVCVHWNANAGKGERAFLMKEPADLVARCTRAFNQFRGHDVIVQTCKVLINICHSKGKYIAYANSTTCSKLLKDPLWLVS